MPSCLRIDIAPNPIAVGAAGPAVKEPGLPFAPGTPTNVLGVYFPGGDVASLAPTVPETVVNYWDFKDNENYPVQVPSGGQIIVKIE